MVNGRLDQVGAVLLVGEREVSELDKLVKHLELVEAGMCEMIIALDDARRTIEFTAKSIDTGRSEPLFAARDNLKIWIEEYSADVDAAAKLISDMVMST